MSRMALPWFFGLLRGAWDSLGVRDDPWARPKSPEGLLQRDCAARDGALLPPARYARRLRLAMTHIFAAGAAWRRTCPGGTFENSPAIYRRDCDFPGRRKSRRNDRMPRIRSAVPTGLGYGRTYEYPALKCWAILKCPYGAASQMWVIAGLRSRA